MSSKIYRYHVNEDGESGPCTANDPNDCRFTPGKQVWHKETEAEVEKEAEHILAKEQGLFGYNKKIKTVKTSIRERRVDDPEVMANTNDKTKTKTHEITESNPLSANDNPNDREYNRPEVRYLAAQERSRKLSMKQNPPDKQNSQPIKGKDDLSGIYNEKYTSKGAVKTIQNSLGQLHSSYKEYSYEDAYSKVSYRNGIVHRDEEFGPAVILKDSGAQFYVKFGLLHRRNGPAVETDESVEYWQNGLRHNIGAPAVVKSNGEVQFWRKGKHEKTIFPDDPNNHYTPPSIKASRERWKQDAASVKRAENDATNFV